MANDQAHNTATTEPLNRATPDVSLSVAGVAGNASVSGPRPAVMLILAFYFAVATYFTSLYFQRRREIREQELHEHMLLVDLKKQLADSLDKKRDI